MAYFFILLLIIVIIAIVAASQNAQRLKTSLTQSKKILDEQIEFTPTESLLSGISFAYDAGRRKVCFLTTTKTAIIYNYSDILQSELVIDNEIITRHSNSSAIGRAAIGGLLFGGVGAIVGGATSSSRQTAKVNSIELKITMNDMKFPVWRIAFLATPVMRNSVFFKRAYINAERWQGIITVIIKQEEAVEKPDITAIGTTSDEILKLKDMFDKGILSETEFAQAKQKLLA
jgi:hypothetical protein